MTAETLLEKEILVYDIEQMIKDRSDKKYTAHCFKQMAIIFNSDGSGVIADYEAIGYDFDSPNYLCEIPFEEYKERVVGQPYTIQILPSGYSNYSISDIMRYANKTKMKGKEFFTKWQYNARCSSNFRELLNSLRG